MTQPAVTTVAELVEAALASAEFDDLAATAVRNAIAGSDPLLGPDAGSQVATGPDPAPAPVYVEQIEVTAFRGIGTLTKLALAPGPGLVIVSGRNGSGKSTIADAAEVAMTGQLARWNNALVAWKEGWRNLHSSDPSTVVLHLHVDGETAPVRLTRSWTATATKFEDGSSHCDRGEGTTVLNGLPDWAEALELQRPFLSYAELARQVEGKPSALYDTIHNALGLQPLVNADGLLQTAFRENDNVSKELKRRQKELLDLLAASPDERAQPASDAVTRLELIPAGLLDASTPLASARQLSQLKESPPDPTESVAAAIEVLRNALTEADSQVDGDAARSRQLADLLAAALNHHTAHDDGPCPVCGTGQLDGAWREQTTEELRRLREEASAFDLTQAALSKARTGLSTSCRAVPGTFEPGLPGDVNDAAASVSATAAEVTAALNNCMTLEPSPTDQTKHRDDADATLLAAVLANHTARVALADAAADTLRAAEDAWRPLAAELVRWNDALPAGLRSKVAAPAMKAAREWLSATAEQIREQRFAPLTEASDGIWQMLRAGSSIELGPITPRGTTTSRKINLEVLIDGEKSSAQSVMSQGEIHALGLALFLPRATLETSPFRFVVIDDPVQAMDPAKVDGLARLLAQTAVTRQVIVFTHDDRLAESARRLELGARLVEVHRGERSEVEIRETADPVARHLDDATAIVLTRRLPDDVQRLTVAAYCRSALESAAQTRIRKTRLAAGDRHAEVDALLERLESTEAQLACAFLGDEHGHGLKKHLNKTYGTRAADVLVAVTAGSHTAYPGDLADLVAGTAELAAALG